MIKSNSFRLAPQEKNRIHKTAKRGLQEFEKEATYNGDASCEKQTKNASVVINCEFICDETRNQGLPSSRCLRIDIYANQEFA